MSAVLVLACAGPLIVPMFARAQDVAGAIEGRVVDREGAGVVGAQVVVARSTLAGTAHGSDR